MTRQRSKNRYAICVRNGTYRASLQPRSVYRILDEPDAERHAMLRVIDESGEDYLFPADLFVPIDLPAQARSAFRRASGSVVARPARRSRRTPTR